MANRADRTVTVAIGHDGTWLVAIPAGALSGLADIAMFGEGTAPLPVRARPGRGHRRARPDLGPIAPGCVKVASCTAGTDPRVQHIFTDWIDPLLDRATAPSVAVAKPLAGRDGTCFSVESNSAALAPPVDPGIYCYRADGILTAAKVGFGTLTLAGAVAAAPPSVAHARPAGLRAPPPLTAPALPPTPAPTITPAG